MDLIIGILAFVFGLLMGHGLCQIKFRKKIKQLERESQFSKENMLNNYLNMPPISNNPTAEELLDAIEKVNLVDSRRK